MNVRGSKDFKALYNIYCLTTWKLSDFRAVKLKSHSYDPYLGVI